MILTLDEAPSLTIRPTKIMKTASDAAIYLLLADHIHMHLYHIIVMADDQAEKKQGVQVARRQRKQQLVCHKRYPYCTQE